MKNEFFKREEYIDAFDNEYSFLSNFYIGQKIIFLGVPCTTAEHAYQMMKAETFEDKINIVNALTPEKAKRLGNNCKIVKNWNNIKDSIMYQVVQAKFIQDDFLMLKLLSTEGYELIEGNNWGDTYWGECNGIGRNKLGKILMSVRANLHAMGLKYNE